MNTTVENNKLIAEFIAPKRGQQVYIKHLNAWFDDSMGYKFHSSFDWLMGVVEKIESLGYSIIINENWCIIKSKRTLYKKERIANIKIEAVYNACVEFIKWYNNQNSAK